MELEPETHPLMNTIIEEPTDTIDTIEPAEPVEPAVESAIEEPAVESTIEEPAVEPAAEPAAEPAVESTTPLTPDNVTVDHPDIVEFWQGIRNNFGAISNAILNGGIKRGDAALVFMQTKLMSENLRKFVELEVTFGQINKQNLDSSKKLIELYISPKLNAANIPVMSAMYLCYRNGNKIPNLNVIKYKPYHPKDAIIADIEFKAFKATYDDFGFHGSFGYSEEKKPQMNLVIMVKQPLADQILQKKTIYFDNPNRSSRDVWMCSSSNAVDLFLINILGEYNLLHHIGYIELLPSDDPLVENTAVFTELSDIKSRMVLIDKQYSYQSCDYCNRHGLTVIMSKCSRCHSASYCSVGCQLSDYPSHKPLCNK